MCMLRAISVTKYYLVYNQLYRTEQFISVFPTG
jgi:hypothetical protein